MTATVGKRSAAARSSDTPSGVARYSVVLTLSEDMLGSAPKSRDVYAKYIATKATPEQGEEEAQDDRGHRGARVDRL